MGYPMILAKPISYGGFRPKSAVLYIIIHYTAGNGDTAKAEALYFHNGNTREAGAHFFTDQSGYTVQSIPIDRVAWSVGGAIWPKEKEKGGASMYGKATNYNSVSIELCDNLYKDPSKAQTDAVRELVSYIQKQCPNAKTIIRHWDVNGKPCPARMTGKANKKWAAFKETINEGVPYRVKVVPEILNVRKRPSAKSKKVGELHKGEVYTIVKENSNKKWGKLKSGLGWIKLSYTKKV